jgi:hypothetical protein
MILHHIRGRDWLRQAETRRHPMGDQATDQCIVRRVVAGRPGYPLVDAAMAQLYRTGYMHHRQRMAAASFQVKNPRIDWRGGERYFAEKLNNYDLRQTTATGSGRRHPAAMRSPTFASSILSPSRKVRPGRQVHSSPSSATSSFTRHGLPVLRGRAAGGIVLGMDYPIPIGQHDEARKRPLQRYTVVKKAGAVAKSCEGMGRSTEAKRPAFRMRAFSWRLDASCSG